MKNAGGFRIAPAIPPWYPAVGGQGGGHVLNAFDTEAPAEGDVPSAGKVNSPSTPSLGRTRRRAQDVAEHSAELRAPQAPDGGPPRFDARVRTSAGGAARETRFSGPVPPPGDC